MSLSAWGILETAPCHFIPLLITCKPTWTGNNCKICYTSTDQDSRHLILNSLCRIKDMAVLQKVGVFTSKLRLIPFNLLLSQCSGLSSCWRLLSRAVRVRACMCGCEHQLSPRPLTPASRRWSLSSPSSCQVNLVSSPTSVLLITGPGTFPMVLILPVTVVLSWKRCLTEHMLTTWPPAWKTLRPSLSSHQEEAAFGARLSLLCSARPQHALVPVFHGLLLFPFFSSPLLSRLWVSFGRGLSTGDGKGIAFACFRCWQLGEVCYAGSLRQQMRTEPGCCLKARTQEFLIEIISLCLLRAIDTCLLKKSV